ncbi:hypothetical protein V6N13_010218 [Hibiscus sabdariffa]
MLLSIVKPLQLWHGLKRSSCYWIEASCKGYIKVNVDGVFDLGLDAATIGIVDRDGNGSILSDFGQRTTDCNEATLAEIAALDNAVKVPYF